MVDQVVGQDADRVGQAVPAARRQDKNRKSLRSNLKTRASLGERNLRRAGAKKFRPAFAIRSKPEFR